MGQGWCHCCHQMNPPHPLTCLCWRKKGPVPHALVVFRALDFRTVMTFLKAPSWPLLQGRESTAWLPGGEGWTGFAGLTMWAWPLAPQVEGAPCPDPGEGCSDQGPSAALQERPGQGHPGLPEACQVCAICLRGCRGRDPELASSFL